MLTLADRFDLDTGDCRDEEIPPEKRPKVRVTDLMSLAADVGSKPLSRKQANEVEVSPERIAPVPLWLTSRDVVPLTVLEEHLASGGRKPPVDSTLTGGLRPPLASFGPQFTAEDGSDRHAWLRPWKRVPGSDMPLRDVLDRWDWRDPEGWRSLSPDAEMTEMLARFAASTTFRKLMTARTCRRDVEFLLDPAAGDGAVSTLPRLWGVIDCLWQDAEENWHLLAWTTGPLEEARLPGLVVQAWSVQQQLGSWPETVGLYSFAQGEALTRTSRELPHQAVVATVRAALSGLLEQPWTE
jgi:hypothetical protein